MQPNLGTILDIVDAQEREHASDMIEHYATLDRHTARIAELEALLITGLALHGGTAFTASEIEWREAARKTLNITKG